MKVTTLTLLASMCLMSVGSAALADFSATLSDGKAKGLDNVSYAQPSSHSYSTHNPAAVRSDLINPGFESDLTGWATAGVTAAIDQELYRDFTGKPDPQFWGPQEGNLFASLWSTNSQGTNVSKMSQTFNALAGEVLTFEYFFDYGDFVLFGPDTATATLQYLGHTETLFFHSGEQLGDGNNIDWTLMSVDLPSTATYTLEFCITDANGAFESILGVDDVAVIPSPSAAALGIIGVAGLGFWRRK